MRVSGHPEMAKRSTERMSVNAGEVGVGTGFNYCLVYVGATMVTLMIVRLSRSATMKSGSRRESEIGRIESEKPTNHHKLRITLQVNYYINFSQLPDLCISSLPATSISVRWLRFAFPSLCDLPRRTPRKLHTTYSSAIFQTAPISAHKNCTRIHGWTKVE